MKVIVVGNGIAGLYAAYSLSNKGISVVLVSPEIPERSQSVMAAGGINAAIDTMGENDSVELHIEETLKSGRYIENREMVESLCNDAPNIISELADMGVMFNRDKNNTLLCRSFGGQSKKRTVYAGTSTGKQIITALNGRTRKAQKEGRIVFLCKHRFLKGLIEDGVCCGGMFLDEKEGSVKRIYADAVVMATGGQNKIFGKTTGSVLCDGFAAAKLFTQGVNLKNLEFIQYHPTAIETATKRMLISEAARGEGGRLFYCNDDGSRCYFMEEKYGERGNLQTREVVSKEIYDSKKDVYLDISFLGEKTIREKLPEIYDICKEYINIDVTKEPIPISPTVHFFMGGIAVDKNHETNISRLFAIGECASAYHGANRLGGNSLLATIHSAKLAAENISKLSEHELSKKIQNEFDEEQKALSEKLKNGIKTKNEFSENYLINEISKTVQEALGVVRDGKSLENGLKALEFYKDAIEKVKFDGSLTPYESYFLPPLYMLAKATVKSALFRKESRGAHIRTDYPEELEEYRLSTIASCENNEILLRGEKA